MKLNFIETNYSKFDIDSEFKCNFKKITKGISKTLVSFFNTLTSINTSNEELEKNKVICIEQCSFLDKKIFEIKLKYKEFEDELKEEISEVKFKTLVFYRLKKELFGILLLVEKLADQIYYGFLTYDDPNIEDWFSVMDNVKRLHHCCIRG